MRLARTRSATIRSSRVAASPTSGAPWPVAWLEPGENRQRSVRRPLVPVRVRRRKKRMRQTSADCPRQATAVGARVNVQYRVP
jgi:hypothetical protein